MAIILTDFRIFRKIITKICDIFFSQKNWCHIISIQTGQCPPRNHLDKEPSQQWGRGWEGRELSKCDIWPRMVIILTDFWIFTKKLSISDIFSHKNWCHLPLNSHESTKNSLKKITKIGDNLLIENVTKIGEK